MTTEKVVKEGTEVFSDIAYWIDYKVYSYHIDFTVYETCPTRKVDSDVWDIWFNGEMGPVEKKEEAEVFLSGSVKWDGCSNWDFHTDECMKHACSREQLVQVGELLGRLWDMGKAIPNWSE